MYATAMRVTEPRTGTTGINVFLYRHGDSRVFEETTASRELLKRVTEAEPGDLVEKWIVLPGGGHDVLSYVDVIAPDRTARDPVAKALRNLRARVKPGSLPVYRKFKGGVLVAFNAVYGLGGLELREYDALREALEPLLARLPESEA
jgi:hypothetical protein